MRSPFSCPMKVCLSFLVFALALAAFSAAGSFGIVNLDDVLYLVDRAENYGFRWAFTWLGDAMWTPLTWLSYWLDRSLFGTNWSAYHWHGILLHAVGSVLLFLLMQGLVARLRIAGAFGLLAAFGATLLWAVHPLRVESVVWLAGRKDCLSTCLFLGALLAWSRAGGARGIILSLSLLLLGGMAKSSVMVFPLFAGAMDFCLLRRRRPVWAYASAVVLCGALAVEAALAQKAGGADYVASQIPSWFRFANAGAAITVYFENLLWPMRLAAQCQLKYPAWPRVSIFGLLLAAAGIVWIACWVRRCLQARRVEPDPIAAGLLAFLAALVPFLGLSGFGSHAFADRFTILPSLGFCFVFAGVAQRLADRVKARRLFLVLSAVIGGFLMWRTVVQTGFWRDDRTLFERTVAIDGEDNVLAQEELVMYYYEMEHDFAQMFRHGVPMMRGPVWQQKSSAHLGPLLIEAAYETGHPKEAEDFYFWQLKMGREKLKDIQRTNPLIGDLDVMRFSDVVRLAYKEGQLEEARSQLRQLEKEFPESFIMRNVRYLLARRGGDEAEIERMRKAAYSPNGDSYLHNRWALER